MVELNGIEPSTSWLPLRGDRARGAVRARRGGRAHRARSRRSARFRRV